MKFSALDLISECIPALATNYILLRFSSPQLYLLLSTVNIVLKIERGNYVPCAVEVGRLILSCSPKYSLRYSPEDWAIFQSIALK